MDPAPEKSKKDMKLACSIKIFVSAVNLLSEPKKEQIRKTGLKSILTMPDITIQRKFCTWLTDRYDQGSKSIELEGRIIPISTRDATVIMDLSLKELKSVLHLRCRKLSMNIF